MDVSGACLTGKSWFWNRMSPNVEKEGIRAPSRVQMLAGNQTRPPALLAGKPFHPNPESSCPHQCFWTKMPHVLTEERQAECVTWFYAQSIIVSSQIIPGSFLDKAGCSRWLPSGNGWAEPGRIFQRNGATPHTVYMKKEAGLSDIGGPRKCLHEGCPGLWTVGGKTPSLSPILWSPHLHRPQLSLEMI